MQFKKFYASFLLNYLLSSPLLSVNLIPDLRRQDFLLLGKLNLFLFKKGNLLMREQRAGLILNRNGCANT